MLSRQEILLDAYAKALVLEGHVMSDMVLSRILPTCKDAVKAEADLVASLKNAGLDTKAEAKELKTRYDHVLAMEELCARLDAAITHVNSIPDVQARARAARDEILSLMAELRTHADAMERVVDDACWPLPKYSELLWIH